MLTKTQLQNLIGCSNFLFLFFIFYFYISATKTTEHRGYCLSLNDTLSSWISVNQRYKISSLIHACDFQHKIPFNLLAEELVLRNKYSAILLIIMVSSQVVQQSTITICFIIWRVNACDNLIQWDFFFFSKMLATVILFCILMVLQREV